MLEPEGPATAVIRRATPEDSVGLARVHVASWRATYEGLLPQDVLDGLSEVELARAWRDQMQREEPPGSLVLVLVEGQEIVGYARFGPARDQDSVLAGGIGEIYGLYLHPEGWGRGLGHALIEASLDELSSRRFHQVTLNVVEGNDRARFFYERQGWTLDRQAAPWYGAPQVRYRKEL